jgi:hypothetical protein
MEVTKNLQKDCSGVIITLNQSNADYTVMLNRESKQNRGLLRTNSQVQVAQSPWGHTRHQRHQDSGERFQGCL